MKPNILTGYKPEKLFGYFEEITKIPRPSFKEGKIADYLVSFAKDRNLFCIRDKMNNVFIRCPASKGYEDKAPFLLQGHTDMVCEKNSDTDFNFDIDALHLYVDENNYLHARGTTLGADDGVAVAAMLAALDGALPYHPALECLFTVQEEVGLNGALAFDYSQISARKLINLDSENDGEVVVGCAGGMCSKITLTAKADTLNKESVILTVCGLAGGHSGENIDSRRANAVKIMGRLLMQAAKFCEFNLVSIDGGSKDNAIPRECSAVLTVASASKFELAVNKVEKTIANELSKEDCGFKTVCEKTKCAIGVSRNDTDKIVLLISSVTNGVISMSRDVKGLVEFSRNLGIVHTVFDNGNVTFEFTFSTRSAIESQIKWSACELEGIAKVIGGKINHFGKYPGWEYEKISPLRDSFFECYKKLFGKEPKSSIIHAGLECGIIKSAIPDMDIISIGPGMNDIHSPSEKLDLQSFERLWLLIEKMICG